MSHGKRHSLAVQKRPGGLFSAAEEMAGRRERKSFACLAVECGNGHSFQTVTTPAPGEINTPSVSSASAQLRRLLERLSCNREGHLLLLMEYLLGSSVPLPNRGQGRPFAP